MTQQLERIESVCDNIPVYGWLFSGALKFYDFCISFDQPDPWVAAVAQLQAQITKLESEFKTLNDRLNQLAQRVGNDENKNHSQRLADIQRQIASIVNRIANKPQNVNVRQEIAFDAGQIPDIFLDDPSIWQWTDFKTTYTLDDDGYQIGAPALDLLEPDFKVVPTQSTYALSLMTWITAIDLDTGGDVAAVERNYGDRLRRHIPMNRVRNGYDDLNQAPETFPENVMARIICHPIAEHKYALDHQCDISIQCDNAMRRSSRTPVRDVTIYEPEEGPSVMCMPPENLGIMDERDLEDQEGNGVFSGLADMLERVLLTGSLRTQFIGTFGASPTVNIAWMYAIAQNGDLFWYKQTPSSSASRIGPWTGPKLVGHSWTFRAVLPAGGNSFYGLASDGTLHWYRHDGFNDGSVAWSGPTAVGHGWNGFKQVFSGSDGVLYAIQPNGDLLWYKHLGFRNGSNEWLAPKKVGNGWQSFKTVFSVGGGVIYAVAADGSLMWYRHEGFGDGSERWQGAHGVGTGWQNFREIMGVDQGVIFGVLPDGGVLWYQHTDWQTGGASWLPSVIAARGFVGYRQIFAIMPSSPEQPS